MKNYIKKKSETMEMKRTQPGGEKESRKQGNDFKIRKRHLVHGHIACIERD